MDQRPTNPPPPHGRSTADAGVSSLAIAALVVSVIGCCPFVSLIGSVMGMAAMRRIALSDGALRGGRIAHAAVIVGLVLGAATGIGWSLFLSHTQTWGNREAQAIVEEFMRHAQAEQPGLALRGWGTTVPQPSEDQVRSMGRELQARYGSFKSFRVTSVVLAGDVFSGRYDAAGTFAFERGDQPGSVGFVLEPPGSFAMPLLRLRDLRVEDREAGDVRTGEVRPAANVTTRPR